MIHINWSEYEFDRDQSLFGRLEKRTQNPVWELRR